MSADRKEAAWLRHLTMPYTNSCKTENTTSNDISSGNQLAVNEAASRFKKHFDTAFNFSRDAVAQNEVFSTL